MSAPLGQVILDLGDAGAVHLRCVACGAEARADPDVEEGPVRPAGIWLATLITWSIRHRCAP